MLRIQKDQEAAINRPWSCASMNSHTLRVLEYDKIKTIAAGYAVSAPGKAMALELMPATDLAEVERRLAETQEAMRLLRAGGQPRLDEIKDIRPQIAKLKAKGGVLEPGELLNIAAVLKAGRSLKVFFQQKETEVLTPLLSGKARAIRPLPEMEKAIYSAINEQAEVKDSASPELRKIRKRLAALREEIVDRLSSLMRDAESRKVVQEHVITLREDRYVLPLKPNFRQQIKGVVHGHSGSGATLFVEPLEVLEQNNRLAELKAEEKEEVQRILRALTALLWPEAGGIDSMFSIISELDMILGRAGFGIDFGATVPEVSNDGGVHLKQARHPLLVSKEKKTPRGRKVQPNDISLGGPDRLLIVSGPNAGGKTVVLKTVGLLSLMAQAGLPVTASEGSRLPVFRAIYADIGDEQSLEESISTFSSHAGRIAEILAGAGRDSLVLLDELGAGTDPAEGAALGAAVLEKLLGLGSMVVATTHHSQLKVFGAETPGAVNASMEFDAETLRPTYRMIAGRPGRSYGLQMAGRMGVPADVVAKAAERLGSDGSRLDSLLERMEQDSRELAHELEQAREELAKARLERQEAERLLIAARKEAGEITARAKAEARDVLRTLRRRLNELSAVKPDVSSVAEVRREIEGLSAKLSQYADERPLQEETRSFGIGDRVRIPRLNLTGIVTGVHRDSIDVEIAGKAVRIHAAEALAAGQAASAPADIGRTGGWSAEISGEEGLPDRLNIIGLRVDEALFELDRFIDRASLEGFSSVCIIHGLGTGALKQAVARFLKDHPLVRTFRLGAPQEGGAGVTVAELKK